MPDLAQGDVKLTVTWCLAQQLQGNRSRAVVGMVRLAMGGGCPLCADVRLGMWGRARSHGRQYKGNGKVLQVDKVGDIININRTFLSRFDLISGKPSTIATLPLMYQVFRNPQQIPRRSFAAKLSYFSARISAGKQLFRNQKKLTRRDAQSPQLQRRVVQ